MAARIIDGKKTAEEIINIVSTKGTLTPAQRDAIKAAEKVQDVHPKAAATAEVDDGWDEFQKSE